MGSGGDAAAKLVDGYDPGDGARECEAGQNCFDAERAEKAPVAVKGEPGFEQEYDEERDDGPRQGGLGQGEQEEGEEGQDVEGAPGGVAEEAGPAHAGDAVADGVARQLMAG